MRSLLIATLAAAAYVGAAFNVDTVNLDAPVITQDFVDELNARPGMTWKAAMPTGKHTDITQREFKRLLGIRAETEEDKQLRATFPARQFTKEELATDIPDEFDSIKNWPQCTTIPHIYDQSQCGSCWAVAGAGAMSDRYCTSGVSNNLFISANDLMSCGWGFGCNGGNPLLAWAYWQNSGLVADACQPYPFSPCGRNGKYPPCPSEPYSTPKCENNCSAGSNATYTKYFGNSSYMIWGEENYQREVLTNGPIEVGFMVYEDFLSYSSGIYQHVSGDFKGGHAVRLIGWGSLNGVKYWKIANSWNTEWGMDGFFMIKRGVNECNIELSGTAGLPRK